MAFSPPNPPMFEVNEYNSINIVTNELEVFNLDFFFFGQSYEGSFDQSADEETVEQKEVPSVEKDSGSTEELVNDGQRCAVSEDTGITDDISQENETKSEAKRYVGCSIAVTVSFFVMFDIVKQERFTLKCALWGLFTKTDLNKYDTKQSM